MLLQAEMRPRIFFIVILIYTVAYGSAFENALDDISKVETKQDYRLPLDVQPESYDISITPFLLETDEDKRFKFEGTVSIVLKKIQTPCNTIKLHAKRLNFIKSELQLKNGTKMDIGSNSSHNTVTDIVTYDLNDSISGDGNVLYFEFNGTMDDDMHGFYRSMYRDSNGNITWLGATQFQTNHARRVFPCFDEPKFKARFLLTLKRHKSMKTFSNTKLLRSEKVGDYFKDYYEESPVMSTYLLAFMVCDFKERFEDSFGVVARPEKYKQTEYSFHVGRKLLNVFNEYLNMSYYDLGIDKLHLAAVPDFSAGAMENWGLLTFRERILLYEEGITSLSTKQAIAATVAHEQAHLWFGDLVTCDWWSYTWLNEGFARYFQYFATAKVEPEFDIEKQFVIEQIHTAMALDATNHTNPMTDENTNTPADLARMFNTISYNKGASFIRMVKHAIGEENFQTSMRTYQHKYKYKNTVPQNLFDEWLPYFGNETKSAKSLFATFTEQVGYPVVTFELKNSKLLKVSQKRFLLNYTDGSDPNLMYTIPITFTTDAEKNFDDTETKFFLQNSVVDGHEYSLNTNVSWIVGNVQQCGYYRVNYDSKTWQSIHNALCQMNYSGIHVINRAQIVDDLFNLARASIVEYSLVLNITEYLQNEFEYLPWAAAFNGYSYLAVRMGNDLEEFSNYIRRLTNNIYEYLDFEEKSNDTALDIYNRAKVMAWSCKYGNQKCIAKAKQHFAVGLENNTVPVNLRSVIYCVSMREATEDDFNKLFNKYKNETLAAEETLILNALGCVRNEGLVREYFRIIMSTEVRRQDRLSALTSLYSENNENVDIVFDLIAANVTDFIVWMGDEPSAASAISNLASRFSVQSQLDKFRAFNIKHQAQFGSSWSTLKNAELTVELNLMWSSKHLSNLKGLLSHSPRTAHSSFPLIALLISLSSWLNGLL